MTGPDPLRALVERYAEVVDARTFDDLADVFTEDAVLETGNGRRAGREAIVAAMAGLHRYDRTEHRVLDHQILRPDSGTDHSGAPDAAAGRVEATAHHWYTDDGGRHDRQMTITYHDTYRRTPNGWRITARRLEIVDDVTVALD